MRTDKIPLKRSTSPLLKEEMVVFFIDDAFFWRYFSTSVIMSYMSKRQTLIILGIWVIVLPFLGFPGNWDRIILCASGLIIAAIAYSLRLQGQPKKPSNMPYVEHKNEPAPPSTPTPAL
jgi:hypothetical protein